MIKIKTFVNTIMNAIGNCLSSILSTAIGLVFSIIYPVILDCIMACSSFMNSAFGMSPDQFNRVFPIVKDFQDQLYGLGIALAVGLFILALFRNIFSGLGFEAESPGKMICRFFIAIFLALWLNPILNYLFTTVFGSQYDSLQKISNQSIKWDVLTTDSVGDYAQTAAKICSGIFTSTVIKGFNQASLGLAEEIIAFVMIFMVAIGYFKLAIEIAERYLMVNVLILFSPLAASTIVLESTLNIFKAFFKMFIGQLILLWTNAICLGMTDSALVSLTNDISNANGNNGMIDLIALLAFLYIAQHIDNYLRDLGVNVGITGGGMVSEFIATAGMAKGVVKATTKVGKSMAHGAAGTFGVVGGLSGKKGPASTGNSSAFKTAQGINNANNKGVQIGSTIRNSKLGKTLQNLGSQNSQKRPAANVQKSPNASVPKTVPKPKSINTQKQGNIGAANTNKAASLNKGESGNSQIAANTSKNGIPLTKGNMPETGALKPANTNNPYLNSAKQNAAAISPNKNSLAMENGNTAEAISSPANTNGSEQQMVNPIDKGTTTESAQGDLPVSNNGSTGFNAGTIEQSISNNGSAGLNAPPVSGMTVSQPSIDKTVEQPIQNGLPVSSNNNTSSNQPKINQLHDNTNSVQLRLPKKYKK